MSSTPTPPPPVTRSPDSLTPLELKTRSITPPLSEIEPQLTFDTGPAVIGNMSEQPESYAYLLNLFTVPDIRTYLANANVTEDVHALPIHLQRLISEAKEELVIARTKEEAGIPRNDHKQELQATERLERFRSSIWASAGQDVSNLPTVVIEMVRDDDELQHVLGE